MIKFPPASESLERDGLYVPTAANKLAAKPAVLAAPAEPKLTVNKPEPEVSAPAVDAKEARRAYMREYMAKKRNAAK